MTDPSESVREETPRPVDPEAPIEDAATPELPLEADPADAAEQQRAVTDLDEEDHA